MDNTTLAAFLKPILGPVLVFVGLLLTRWIAIVILRLMPQSRAREVLFDRGLFDRKPWLYAAIVFSTIAGLILWSLQIQGYI